MRDQLTDNIAALRAMKANGWSIDLLLKLAFGKEGFSPRRDAAEKAAVLADYREHLAKLERAARDGTGPSEANVFTSGWLVDEVMAGHPTLTREQVIALIKLAGRELTAGGF